MGSELTLTGLRTCCWSLHDAGQQQNPCDTDTLECMFVLRTSSPQHFLTEAKPHISCWKAAEVYLKSIETVMLHYITSVSSCSQMHSVPAVPTFLCLWKTMLTIGMLYLFSPEGPSQQGLVIYSKLFI